MAEPPQYEFCLRPPTAADRYRRVALVGRYASPGIAGPLSRIAAFVAARGHSVVVAADTARSAPIEGSSVAKPGALGDAADVVIVVGGDGTMLAAARALARFDVPLIGVNQGRLGFLTDIPLAKMEEMLGPILAGRHVEERRTLLETTVHRAADGPAETALALNEVVVNRGTSGGMIDTAVEIDGRFVYALRADGIIIATSTGSTAYALSAQPDRRPGRCPRCFSCLWRRTRSPIGPSRSRHRYDPHHARARHRRVGPLRRLRPLPASEGDSVVTPLGACGTASHPEGHHFCDAAREAALERDAQERVRRSMLRLLSIRNFVVVDALDLELEAASVLTGETGAGKSILLDALALPGDRFEQRQLTMPSAPSSLPNLDVEGHPASRCGSPNRASPPTARHC